MWPIVQGQVVGGTTVINSAICVKTPEDVFDLWQRDHGLPNLRERTWAIQEDIEHELSASVTPPEALGRNNLLAIEGARKLGYVGEVTQRFVADCTGSGRCLQGCTSARKQSLNLVYVPELIRRGGSVLSCAPVRRVRFEGRRAVGVEGRFRQPGSRRWGARFEVRARKGVVVAASATRSPTLLRRSGLRGRGLGRQFMAHPGTAILGWYDTPVDMNLGATQGWASTAFRTDGGFKLETLSIPPELIASRIKGGGSELVSRLLDYRHLAMWVVAVRAETVGSVHRSPFGPMVRYSMIERDMERMRSAAVVLARTHFAAGARWVVPGVHGLPWRIDADQLGLLEDAPLDPRAWVGILSHLFGGCVSGAGSQAVCDPQGRVNGVERLVVADASQIPTTLGVNPQHTIMALARIRAEDLLAT